MRGMREVGLGGEGEKMPNELSGGMRKRAGFARALVLDPEIVLFDEPDSGLDPVRTALLCELIKEIHAEHGGCYVVITHDIMSARRVAEHISVLWKGRIVESGPAEQLFASGEPVRPPVPLGRIGGTTRNGVRAARTLLGALAGAAAAGRGWCSRWRSVAGLLASVGHWRCGPAPAPRRSCRARAASTGRRRVYSRFGEEPVEVLVKGNLQKLLLSSDIVRLARPGGLPFGQGSGERAGPRAVVGRAVRPAGARGHGQGGARARRRSSPEAATQIDRKWSGAARRQAEAKQAEQAVRARRARPRRSEAEALALASSGEAATLTMERSRGTRRRWRCSTGSRAAGDREPGIRLGGGVRLEQARRRAQERASPTCSRAATRR